MSTSSLSAPHRATPCRPSRPVRSQETLEKIDAIARNYIDRFQGYAVGRPDAEYLQRILVGLGHSPMMLEAVRDRIGYLTFGYVASDPLDPHMPGYEPVEIPEMDAERMLERPTHQSKLSEFLDWLRLEIIVGYQELPKFIRDTWFLTAVTVLVFMTFCCAWEIVVMLSKPI